jgi:hypothetical protein
MLAFAASLSLPSLYAKLIEMSRNPHTQQSDESRYTILKGAYFEPPPTLFLILPINPNQLCALIDNRVQSVHNEI